MQTLRKKTSPCKYRNDPGRFFGDGVTFKAKLIGILEVGEARGDKMCQEALQDLKMAIRAAGEHKQRITIHVTIDGLRLRDEKSSDSLYHHPVHKISFIAQDMSDSRAFGYIFGSPDSGHRFFGIKTDKAASQVVLAMRDLFQVVFELKKKEIELARQHIQSKTIHEHQPAAVTTRSSVLECSSSSTVFSKAINEPSTSKTTVKEMSPESVADLVDLEQELSSIQRGITQMEQITPSDPMVKATTEEDPFGDSFTQFSAYNLLPPPESSKSRHSKPLKPPDEQKLSGTPQPLPLGTATTTASNNSTASNTSNNDWLSATSTVTPQSVVSGFDDVKSITTAFEETSTAVTVTTSTGSMKNDTIIETIVPSSNTVEQYIDAFTDLDPLGTGKIKPYIDKKYFFQDLKNPPKKVLKDLSEQDSVFSANFSTVAGALDDNSKNDHKDDGKMFENSNVFDGNNEFANGSKQDKEFNSKFTKSTDSFAIANSISQNIFKAEHKTDDPIIGNNKALLVTDNDPFSPRMKKFDPFEDDFSKVPLDPFDFNFAKGKSTILPDTKITSNDDKPKANADKKTVDFNGPLQVQLPPETYSSYMMQKRVERHNSDASDTICASGGTIGRNRPSVFKQNTVDVINSISSKKMKPHLFSQKYTKRDSNSINMRRLQESDSLSETETAPEPPPRPDTMTHVEPPPLPPKKQFSDIVIRPRVTSPLALNQDQTRYDYVGSKVSQNENSPAIPLPSRKITRTESNFPGPSRPAKKTKEDDYLTPISSSAGGATAMGGNEMPIILPPPQARTSTKNRGRRQPDISPSNFQTEKPEPKHRDIDINLPDITLSQLLTLGIDELATKLNVPTNKLSTMNIVELTKYLSDFIEKSSTNSGPSNQQQQSQPEVAIFKVSFDESTESTFIAKFDDNFGEDDASFVPDFEKFNVKPEVEVHQKPSIDRYAAFREIMEQELKSDDEEDQPNDLNSSIGSEEQNSDNDSNNAIEEISSITVAKIDTKITEVIAQAKDRYAALRDIILVEDLFDKSNSTEHNSSTNASGENQYIDIKSVIDDDQKNVDTDLESSPEINISVSMDPDDTNSVFITNFPTNVEINTDADKLGVEQTSSTKDDLEINEYMNRAISNLSLDSREHLSPISSKSPISKQQNASTSPIHSKQRTTPIIYEESISKTTTLNDMSTSPIPLQKSPARSPIQKSPVTKSPIDIQSIQTKSSPIPQEVANLLESHKRLHSDSLSDVVCGSSPEVDKNLQLDTQPLAATNESWANFDQHLQKSKDLKSPKSPKDDKKDIPESPCSSDDKNDWKLEREGSKRWARGQTSSSSRDVSPWDDDGPDYKRRVHSSSRHGYYMRHGRRMTSGDDDYEYDEDMGKRRDRRMKGSINRSREDFDADGQNWYHPSNHHSWSPPEDDDRMFERSTYERSTYGPPYEKRGEMTGDRKDYKYDKRKYYHNYNRPDYDFDNYGDTGGYKEKKISYYDDYEQRVKCRKDYDEMFEGGGFSRDNRMHKSAKEYFYDREKRSFDRESMESYDSNGRRRKSFGSGDMYGSLGSQEEFRERYSSGEKLRSMRKNVKQRSNEEYDQDSDGEMVIHRGPGDTRSLQRPPQGPRLRKSSGSSPWDGEDLTPTSSQKSWRRPASASESDRKLAEGRRGLTHTLPGSDGEKDRRFRKKLRSRGKEMDYRSNYATMRHPSTHRTGELSYEDYIEDSYRGGTGGPRRKIQEHRSKESFEFDRNIDNIHKFNKGSRDVYYHHDKDQYMDQKSLKSARSSEKQRLDSDDYEDYEKTPRSMVGNQFNFDDEQGFESDFNSPSNGKSLRFSNDFSEKDSPRNPSQNLTPNTESTPTTSQKLRFDDKIIVSKFESNADMFEDDDFSKANFSFENEDQWIAQMPKKNLKSIKHQQENIKKSESVNIFVKAKEDPFEDDDFFKEANTDNTTNSKGIHNNNNNNNNGSSQQHFKWEKNFAKFDENI